MSVAQNKMNRRKGNGRGMEGVWKGYGRGMEGVWKGYGRGTEGERGLLFGLCRCCAIANI